MYAILHSRIGSTLGEKLRAFTSISYNRNFLSGIFVLLVVVFLWTASNFVTQNLYDDGYEKPFLVTYLNTSAFAFYLLPFYVRRRWEEYQKSKGDDSRIGYQPLNTNPELDQRIDGESISKPQPSAPQATLPSLTTKQTANLAMAFAVFWFIANWSLNASLNYTTAASAMILSATSGFFTLGIGRLFHIETLTPTKALAVLTSFSGVVLVCLSDKGQIQPSSSTATKSYQPVLGDFLGLISALFYAFYVILLKIRIGSESRIDMRLFFGFVGLFNIVFAWPVALVLHFIGIEPLEWPPSRNAVIAILVNMGITLSSDYLYVIAMLRTTPVVVTVGLSLTIPFAVIGDIILGHTIHSQVIVGAMLVMASFAVVGLDSSNS